MRVHRSFFRHAASMASAALVVLVARASLADHYRVPSGSMEPTVHVGDHIVVSKIAYGLRVPLTDRWLITFGGPARGDVVVLEPPEGAPADGERGAVSADEPGRGDVLLKRVVALAGDVVEVRGGHVYIDGRPTRDASASLEWGGGPDLSPTRVPDGKVLVLGDNRGNSRDGRYFGFVDVASVLGRAAFVVARDGRLDVEPLP